MKVDSITNVLSLSLLLVISVTSVEEYIQEIRVDENVPRDKSIGRVQPRINGQIRHYSMLGDEEAKRWFRVDGITGEIIVNTLLDREKICKSIKDYSCSMDFRVFLNSENANISSPDMVVKIRIIINDLNDNLPMFDSPNKFLNISEASRIFSNFSLTPANDPDESRFGIVDYRLENGNCDNGQMGSLNKQNQIDEYFRLTENSINNMRIEDQLKPRLHQIKDLDREKVSQLFGCLLAIDIEGNVAKQQIFIRIIDINDNSPQWLNTPYNVSINECKDYQTGLSSYYGRQLITKLDVTDADEGMYGQVNLRIVDPASDLPKMTIENSNLYALTKLDYETLPKFEVKIQAIDGDGLSNFTMVTVHVENCNDHSPQIQIIPRTRPISSMNEEERLQISYTADSEIWLTEESAEAIQLAMIQIEDKDQMNDSNIECRLTRHSDKLVLVPTQIKSMLSLVKKEGALIDREMIEIIHSDLICNDNEKPVSRESTQRISIGVRDVNDNSPFWPGENFQHQIHSCENIDKSISDNYKIFSISEKLEVNSCFARWPARDIDLGRNSDLKYRLKKSSLLEQNILDAATILTIDPITSELCTSKLLDRESDSLFSVKIEVTDNGEVPLSSETNIIICITDINDNAPYFKNDKNHEGFIEFRVDEGSRHRVIGRFTVEDKDFGKNGSLFLSIDPKSISPNDKNVHFAVSPNGDLKVSGHLDREKISEYRMTVKAVDNAPIGAQLTSIASVMVIVQDINDNSPKLFIDQTLNISVSLEAGTLIYQVIAQDPDEGDNARVNFKLRVDNPLTEYFEINSTNEMPDDSGRSVAEIRLKKSLMDYYKNTRKVNLESIRDYQAPFDKIILYIQVTTSKLLINIFPENYQTQLPLLHSPNSSPSMTGSNIKPGDYYQGDDGYTKSGSLTLLLVLAAIVVCIFLGVLATFAILYLKESNNRVNYEVPGDMNNLTTNPHNPGGILTMVQKDGDYALRDEKVFTSVPGNWTIQDDNKYTSLTAAYALENGEVYVPTKTLLLKSPIPTHDFPNYTLQRGLQTNRSINYHGKQPVISPGNPDVYQKTSSATIGRNTMEQVRLVTPKMITKSQVISEHSTLSSEENMCPNQNKSSRNRYNGSNESVPDWSQNYTPLIENQLTNTTTISGQILNANSIKNKLINDNNNKPSSEPAVVTTTATYNNSNSLSSFV